MQLTTNTRTPGRQSTTTTKDASQTKAEKLMMRIALYQGTNNQLMTKDPKHQQKYPREHLTTKKKFMAQSTNQESPPQFYPSGSSNLALGPQLETNKNKSISGQKSKRKTVETTEDEKFLKEGPAAEGVRICSIRNLAFNSEKVHHLAGQKTI